MFRRRGFHGTSLDEVAESAGFSKGAVYSNFAGKDELFLALLDRELEHRTAAVESSLDGGRLGDEAARAMARAYGRLLRDDPAWTLLIIEFAAHAARREPLREELAARNRAIRERMAAAVRRLAGGEPPGGVSAEFVALSAMTLGSGIALEHVIDPEGVPFELGERMNVLILHALRDSGSEGRES